MNIFQVLRVNYEVFHSRMLHWLWSPEGDHGGGDRFWRPIRDLLGVPAANVQITDEVKIELPQRQGWRLADLLIRTSDLLILVENKVDRSYQDPLQIADEIEGGKALAAAEGRHFLFVLVAPGPLLPEIAALVNSSGGVFLPWSELLARLKAVPTSDLAPFTAEVIRQYVAFAGSPSINAPAAAGDEVVRQSEQAIRGILESFAAGLQLTAIDVWARFVAEYPDHVRALDARWAGAKHYSARAWFAFKVQRMAAARVLIEDTGTWQTCNASEWGYSKVRVYRRFG